MPKEYSVKQSKKGFDLFEKFKSEEKPVENNEKVVYLKRKPILVDISLNTILTIILVVGAIYFGSKLITVIGILFFAFIMSSAALPSVRWLHEKGVSKGLAIAIVYSIGIILLLATIGMIVGPFVTEFEKLIKDLPTYVETFGAKIEQLEVLKRFGVDNALNAVSDAVKTFTTTSGTEGFKTVFSAVGNIAGGFISVITSILMSMYIVYDHDNFVDLLLLRIFDEKQRSRVRKLVLDVETKLGSWLLGQTSLSFIIGLMSWILLVTLQVPFALPLAVLAGLLESIPSLGPTISLIPTFLIALVATDPVKAVIVFVGYVVIQQLESTFIVPKVMSSAVGLKPIIVIVAVSAGFALAGPLGALLAVPVAVLLQIALEFYKDLQKLQAKGIV